MKKSQAFLKQTLFVVVIMFYGLPCFADASHGAPVVFEPPVSTYSIVAYDRDRNEMGVAVQSCYFVVGPTVIWTEPGVGVVATQAYVDIAYGPLGLELMRGGKTAPQALKALLAGDPGANMRQVAMIDKDGNVASYTGPRATPATGNLKGKNYSVQGNLLDNDEVWRSMAPAFEHAQGSLARRMLAALKAAESHGGDLRCRQSAALKVVRIRPQGPAYRNVVVDLRVDDHPHPLEELERLLTIREAMELVGQSGQALRKGKLETAEQLFKQAIQKVPDKKEWRFWHGLFLVLSGYEKEGVKWLKELVEEEPQFFILWQRLPGTGPFKIDETVHHRVLEAIRPEGN